MTWALSAASGLLLATGVLPVGDARTVLLRIWPIVLFLAAVTVVAELADAAGLFEAAADLAARAARGRVVLLWLLVVVLATTTTVLLSLDTTAVLLTPVVLALAERLGLAVLPFAMTTIWLANTASLLLPVSNLTNLLAQERLHATAAGWAGRMWAPALASIAVTVAVLWLLHRRDLRGRYHRVPAAPVAHRRLLGLAALTCLSLGVAVAAEVPPWLAACVAGGVLVAGFAVADRSVLRAGLLPWRLVATTVGIFLVVAAADRHGLAALVRDAVGPAAPAGGVPNLLAALRSAGTGVLAGNTVNNLPGYLAAEPAVTDSSPLRLLALVIGTNGGPVITIWGSLATLLWRERCAARAVVVPAGTFALHGVALVALLVPIATLTLVWASS